MTGKQTRKVKVRTRNKATRGVIAAAFLLVVVGFSLTGMPPLTQAGDPPPPSAVLIEEAYQKGRISYETSLLYKVYSIFDPQRLPAEYRSSTPGKCATPILREVIKSWGALSSQVKRELAAYPALLSRPSLSGPELTYDTPHFQIHYTDSGKDAADPAYIEMMGAELENVWMAELEAMGWLQPPSDQTVDGKPDYDVYVQDLPLWYGYIMGDGKADQGVQPGDNENSPGVIELNAWHSYMGLENDYYGFSCTPLDCIRVTVAHEFNHTIQYGYDAWEESWLMEATAVWMEDEVYDYVNDNLAYLLLYFYDPDHCLSNTRPYHLYREYGSWIFMRFISEHHGGQSTVRSVWEHSVNHDSRYGYFAFDALGDALSEIGVSLPTVFTAFSAANYVMSVCPTNDPYCYEEAVLYPNVYVEGSIDFDGGVVHYQPPDGVKQYGTDYIEIDSTVSEATVSVVGMATTTAYAAQLVALRGGAATVIPIPMSGSPSSGSALVDTSSYDSLALIVMNVTPTAGECSDSNYFVILDVGTAPGLDCSAAVSTSCGGSYQGNTTGAPSNVTYYNCARPWEESGPEEVYILTTETTGDIVATLDDISANFDVFILSSCDAMSCLAYGNNAAKLRSAPPGTYYIVVDGYKGASGSYTLSVRCGKGLDCNVAVSASCGGSYQGDTTGAPSNVTYYNCSTWDESGPEEVYVLTTEAAGEIAATLSGMDTGVDLDVFMLSSCDENTTLTYNDRSASYSHASPGTYYIVVDGYQRDSGSYALDISCSTCPGAGAAYITAEDNENNDREGCPDGDMHPDSDCVFKTDPLHPIEFNIPLSPLPPFETAQLSLRAWDVDEGGEPVECVERDEVYFNGEFVGYLIGADKTWSTSVFAIAPSLIQQGNNLVQVYIDVDSCDSCASVDWGQLALDGGGGAASIESVVPDRACYLLDSTANVTTTLRTTLASQEVRVEANVLNAANSYLVGASETATIYGPDQDNELLLSLDLPVGATAGDHTLQIIVFDTCSETQNDYHRSTIRIDPVCETATPTPTGTLTPTSTPTSTPTCTPTGTITPNTPTPTPTSTPAPARVYLPVILKWWYNQ